MKASTIKIMENLATECGYIAKAAGDVITFHEEHPTPITINFVIQESNPDEAFVYFYVRTTSWDLDGERTDANDFFSTMLAVFLRTEAGVSASTWDIPHPMGPMPKAEVYARYVVLDQPFDSNYRLDESGLDRIKKILGTLQLFQLFNIFLYPSAEAGDGQLTYESKYGWESSGGWAQQVGTLVGDPWETEGNLEIVDKCPKDVAFNWRRNPDWNYYRSFHKQVSIFETEAFASSVLSLLRESLPWKDLPGVECRIYFSDSACNAISNQELQNAKDILSKFRNGSESICVPFENGFALISSSHLLFSRSKTGRNRFEVEREKIRKRHEQEAEVLFPISQFIWNEHIDGSEFERLILELLKREPGVARARLMSASNDPDGGRDILCEWQTPPTPGSILEDKKAPLEIRNVVVQCKAYGRSVNKSNVTDIRDTVEHNDATGYFLAVSSHLTSSLTTHLDRMRQGGQIWLDWWNRDEIEERLCRYKDIASKYQNIVKCI